ncbi:M14 family zinc carboxypeptidase [Aquimarina sp. RZ0]|uniref:M14 family zinc carboxypeptidase n=1 Tax=Aquimarina sp. RZ0 TaxID=2607730 RepID=UPI0011F1ED9A|nr:M14 family zinc carboxypeptidase [Aquimarina sp. RZ0]KAA1245197.1 peptidase [Aquimarina sp. RZ0]
MSFYNYIHDILESSFDLEEGNKIGESIGGRDISGYRIGHGPKKISLIAGNHADEPVGPLLLKKLVSYLRKIEESHPLLKRYTWYIVPHTNPDGEQHNKKWYSYRDTKTDLAKYLTHVQRELPGEDIEFGFPIDGSIESLRPENTVVYDFWKTANSSFDLHGSLHGMRATYGPWFLIDKNWIDRTLHLREKCTLQTQKLGYHLYDLDRNGEKGFKRIAEGFCTRPDSQEMRKHFRQLGDINTAKQFHASSMESIRSLGGDCLTLVTEMPLFIFPKEARKLSWPDPYLQKWSEQFAQWKLKLSLQQITAEECNQEAIEMGVISMPWRDQMCLQWQLIVAGLESLC